jgi:hypothetical protein
LEWAVSALGGLDISLESAAEMLGEHYVSAEAQEEAAQAAGGLTVCVGRSGSAGPKRDQRGGVIQAAAGRRIVQTAETQIDIERSLCACEWQAQCQQKKYRQKTKNSSHFRNPFICARNGACRWDAVQSRGVSAHTFF